MMVIMAMMVMIQLVLGMMNVVSLLKVKLSLAVWVNPVDPGFTMVHLHGEHGATCSG